ncbi:MAG TPA: efflux RND transporter periplasmic adaptor subunit [Bryobacteraceae bacterium]
MNQLNTSEEQLRVEVEDLKRQLEQQKQALAAGRGGAAGPSGRTLAVVVLLLVALAVAGYFLGYAPRQHRERVLAAESRTSSQSLLEVNVAEVKRSGAQTSLVLPGSIEAVTEAPVLARASGYIRKRLVDIGDRVAAGQMLAEIEAPEIDQQILQAKAQDDQAASAIQQAQANLVQGQANLQLAEVTKDRWQKLFDKGVVSRQENDTYRAQWAAQQANVDALGKAVAAARSNLGAAQANLARLNDLQSYQTVRAPFAGVITLRNVDTGALVTEGATLLFRIAQTDRLRTYLNVPQADADSVRPGQRATLVIPDLAGKKFPGVVTRSANALDPSSRTLLVEVQAPNSDGLLMPGMYAQVDLAVPRKEPPLVIPGDTLVVRDNVTQAAVVAGDGTVHFQRIQLGRDLGDRLEVLSGLEQGQLLAVNPSDAVREGVKVKPVRAEKPAAP